MKKGIVIYAIGHVNYYYMAENLAASLIGNGIREAGISIALICEDKNKLRYPQLFNDFIILERHQYIGNGKIVFNNATILIYDLSPYDITIKLDADMIWIGGRPVTNLFNELKDIDITFTNTGFGWKRGKSPWTSESDLIKAYGFKEIDLLYRIYGEFIYFTKSRKAELYFDIVKEVYAHPKVSCQEFSNGSMTDELAYQIACMLTGIYPHRDNYTPVFNHFLELKEFDYWHPYQLPEIFYAYSIGGNATNRWTKNGYDLLARHYFHRLGLAGPYLASNKKSFLPERIKI